MVSAATAGDHSGERRRFSFQNQGCSTSCPESAPTPPPRRQPPGKHRPPPVDRHPGRRPGRRKPIFSRLTIVIGIAYRKSISIKIKIRIGSELGRHPPPGAPFSPRSARGPRPNPGCNFHRKLTLSGQSSCSDRARVRTSATSEVSRKVKHDVNEAGRRIGEGHPRARYSDSTVEQILRANEAGVSSQSISLVLGMPASTVRSIVNGQARRQEPTVWRTRCRRSDR